jgi:DNA-binding LacI/PurR family transcriptional regulator
MAGRTLRKGRSDLVVCILPNWPVGSVVGELIETLSAAAAERRLTLAILREGDGPAPLASVIRTLAPAAIINLDILPRDIQQVADTHGIPVVSAMLGAGRGSDLSESQHRVGHMQVQHLAARGHRQLGVLSPADDRIRLFGDARREGAIEACAELGLNQPMCIELPLDRELMRDAAMAWRRAGVTAICGYNDEWAMGLLSGMQLAGLSAPHDLAIIGCDDVPTAKVASPPLTTIRQDMATYSTLTMAAVAQQLGIPVETQRLDSTMYGLIVRESA